MCACDVWLLTAFIWECSHLSSGMSPSLSLSGVLPLSAQKVLFFAFSKPSSSQTFQRPVAEAVVLRFIFHTRTLFFQAKIHQDPPEVMSLTWT